MRAIRHKKRKGEPKFAVPIFQDLHWTYEPDEKQPDDISRGYVTAEDLPSGDALIAISLETVCLGGCPHEWCRWLRTIRDFRIGQKEKAAEAARKKAEPLGGPAPETP